jgi:tRNA G18 (ribose-2'-O)-methylase SpoU
MIRSRNLSRRDRYDRKLKEFTSNLPISLCCVNFMHDGNLGYLIRSAACFGAEALHVIGSVPKRSVLNPLSGSLYDYVKIVNHKNPTAFLDYASTGNFKIISAELCTGAEPIDNYEFDYSSGLILVVGNETSGVPIEILNKSDKVYIPMPGVGFCLNTSQAANILLYEATSQYCELKRRETQ